MDEINEQLKDLNARIVRLETIVTTLKFILWAATAICTAAGGVVAVMKYFM